MLIVEDNPDLVRMIAFLLENDYKIAAAADGVEGLEKARSEKPHLVISDIMMPRKNGYELCRQIKADSATARIPVILLTTKGETEMRIEGFECGADDYLAKPFNAQELRARIRNLIRLREIEAQMSHTQKLASIGVMIAGVTHEIFNPLNAAMSGLRVLKDCCAQTQAQDEQTLKSIDVSLSLIQEGLQRIHDIVRSLNDFSRKKDSETFKPARIGQLIEAACRMARHKIDAKHIEFKKELKWDGMIECAPERIEQVLINLISNACDAIKERGTVTVRTEQDEGRAVIHISDTGDGIAPEIMDTIFDPFFTTKDEGEGSGLGLSICHRIIEEHSGSIQAFSEKGKGARFVITLPVNKIFTFLTN